LYLLKCSGFRFQGLGFRVRRLYLLKCSGFRVGPAFVPSEVFTRHPRAWPLFKDLNVYAYIYGLGLVLTESRASHRRRLGRILD